MSHYDDNLLFEPRSYRMWGEAQIEQAARDQMNNVMRLPVTLAGALMPDAHVGYGLPIGGVLATDDAVIPFAVGVDIACRMRLSIYPVSPIVIGQQTGKFKNALMGGTRFGAGGGYRGNDRAEHEVLDDLAWRSTGFFNSLKDTAHNQLGTSGSGNHFVEWGAFKLEKDESELDLEAGEYLALLSHSGSRGLGFQIADRYSRLAREYHPNLDKTLQHLAWFPLTWELGQEYWTGMELAGRFAAACHEVIHQRVAKLAGVKPIAEMENHHNFAWKEQIVDADGREREAIVHRKGATPANEGEYGIIPGSMGDAGYLVRGKGNTAALNSASHGAGRKMSRKEALTSITKTDRNRYLKERNVTLIGGDLDESPQAYKDIDEVIVAQTDLVDVIGKFTPRMVRMDGKSS